MYVYLIIFINMVLKKSGIVEEKEAVVKSEY